MSIIDKTEDSKEEQKSILFENAFDKFVLKKDVDAISILDDLLEIDEENADAYSMRASCLNNLGYHLDAIDDYKKSLELKEDANINGLCGCAYISIGEYKQANKFLEKAVNSGMKIYSSQLSIVSSTLNDDLLLESLKKKAVTKNKLKRRVSSKPINNIQTSPLEVISALKEMLPNIESAIKLDPENIELKETYDKAKQNLELVNIIEFYLTRKEYPTNDEMYIDLVKKGYKPEEADEIASMFIDDFNKGV